MGIIYSIKVELKEPLTIGMHQMVGNQIDTCDFVPATTLRGAIASALAGRGKLGRLPALFGSSFPRWSPCWPSSGLDYFTVPMPFAFLRNRDDAGFDGEFGVINGLQAEMPSDKISMADFCVSIGRERDSFCPDRFQWDRVAPGWLAVPPDHAAGAKQSPVTLQNIMHVALNYDFETAREGALFSRTAVAESSIFRGYVVDPDGAIQAEDMVEDVFLGKRKSAGNGYAAITWKSLKEAETPPFMTKPKPSASEATVQFLSPAIVAGRNGGFLRGLDNEAWNDLLGTGTDVKVEKAFSSSFLVQGWSMAWDLPRERMPAIAAGSCFRIRTNGDRKTFSDQLAHLVEKGVGMRTGEGFGWVAVAPPWLEPLFFNGNGSMADPLRIDPEGHADIPSGWPEAWKNQELIEKAAKLAHDAQQEGMEAGSFKELEIIAGRLGELESLVDYLKSQAQRVDLRGWEKVWGVLMEYLDSKPRLNEARFVIAWINAFLASK